MGGRFSRSWQLAKASWSVLMSDRSLLIYPALSAVASIGLAALIGWSLYASGVFDSANPETFGLPQFAGLYLFMLVGYLVTFFCNTALVSVVMRRLNGDMTPYSGWSFARSRIGTIAEYAIIAATVGVVLSAISSRSRGLGRIAASLGGAAWSIATFLVVPVLVVEDLGPIDTIKRSAGLLRKTWGEQVIGNAGISLATGLISFVVMLIGGVLVLFAFATGVTVLIVLAVAIAVIAFVIVGVVASALDAIFRAVLYRYATDQATSSYPASGLLPEAFAPKK